MKKFIVAFTVFFFVEVLSAQADKAGIDGQVVAIQKELKNCKRDEQVRTANAFREVYSREGQICMVRVRSLENDTDKEVTWYFKDSKLIYCETIWVDFRGIVTFSESHYLSENQLVFWVENSYEIKPETDKFKERAVLMQVAGEELLEKIAK